MYVKGSRRSNYAMCLNSLPTRQLYLSIFEMQRSGCLPRERVLGLIAFYGRSADLDLHIDGAKAMGAEVADSEAQPIAP
jgi:threonine aldolase